VAAYEKVENEISFGRIAGPIKFRPISNLICSLIGLAPKITHLSYPPGNSVNDCIDEKLATVQYSKFDNIIYIIQT
jgi:hypothetical protein